MFDSQRGLINESQRGVQFNPYANQESDITIELNDRDMKAGDEMTPRAFSDSDS